MPKSRDPKFEGRATRDRTAAAACGTRVGGRPIGLGGPWPVCRVCGHAMEFLLQLDLARPVPVADAFAAAYLFVCPHYEDYEHGVDGQPCPTWDASAGANALILQSSPSATPVGKPRGVKTWPARLIQFAAYEKAPAEDAPAGSIDADFLKRIEQAVADAPVGADEIEIEMPDVLPPRMILIGGDPQWLQSPQRPKCPNCRGRMKLLAQVDADVGELDDDEDYYLPFGSGGVGYLFACERECTPTGTAFLWQTT